MVCCGIRCCWWNGIWSAVASDAAGGIEYGVLWHQMLLVEWNMVCCGIRCCWWNRIWCVVASDAAGGMEYVCRSISDAAGGIEYGVLWHQMLLVEWNMVCCGIRCCWRNRIWCVVASDAAGGMEYGLLWHQMLLVE